MFWAINETGFGSSDKTGLNVNHLARVAQKAFNNCTPDGPKPDPVDPNPPKPDPPKPDPTPTPAPPTGTSVYKEGHYCPYFDPPSGSFDSL